MKKKREAEKVDESDWDDAHPEITCDRCGFTDNQEDYFQIVDGQILCDQCARSAQKEQYDESWVGDKAKAGWNKVKSGAKKVAKAVGDAFKGPFRKGDQIVMKGEDGETYKGTIKGFDLGDKTYEVLLGNPVNEDIQEEVLDMPDRVEELDKEIDRLWRRLGDVDDKTVSKLILACIELEKLEPGSIVDALGDYANFPEK